MRHANNYVGCRKSGLGAIPREITCKACLNDKPLITIRELLQRLDLLVRVQPEYADYTILLDKLPPGSEAKVMCPQFILDNKAKTITFSYYEE